MVMELLIIALDIHMIPYFMADEIWYAFMFHICDFDYHASCELRKMVKVHSPLTY